MSSPCNFVLLPTSGSMSFPTGLIAFFDVPKGLSEGLPAFDLLLFPFCCATVGFCLARNGDLVRSIVF